MIDYRKDIKEYADLYGYSLTVNLLAHYGYKTVSFRKGSNPSYGSPNYPIKRLDTNVNNEVFSVTNHEDGSITLKTRLGFLRFFK